MKNEIMIEEFIKNLDIKIPNKELFSNYLISLLIRNVVKFSI
jgi:hypothetical protein